MVQKRAEIPGLGEVMLSKRRGTRNLRLSVSAKGTIRIGMPTWVPYAAGIQFALSRKDWLTKHAAAARTASIANGSRIGKSYRVEYRQKKTTASARLDGRVIKVSGPGNINNPDVQYRLLRAAERALKNDAQNLLPGRVGQLAKTNGYVYKNLKIKKMSSRWGSCASDKTITLSIYLIQLPWDFIDYVILHELAHTKQMNHSPAFWRELEASCPNAKQFRKSIRQFRPVINSVAPSVA